MTQVIYVFVIASEFMKMKFGVALHGVATGLASGHIALRILKSTSFCALLHWQLDVAPDW